MNTPVLTKQQQRHSLSAKKSTAKGLKNVLSQPQDTYWPVIATEKRPALEDLLNKLMPAMKRPLYSIPWSQLRRMKKQERMQAKKEAFLKETNVPNSDILNSVVLGINAVTRLLEKDNACCVLMDANIEPQLLAKHIIHMAQNKKVPILLLPKLKTVTLNTVGFAAAACALKNIAMDSPDHHFHSLYTTIYNIFKDIPIPKNRLRLFKDVETSEETMLCEEDKICLEENCEVDSSESVKFTISTDVYVYRSSRTERAFVPPSATESITNETTVDKMEEDGFISIINYDSDEYDASIKKNSRYVNIHEDKDLEKRKGHIGERNISPNITYLPLKVKRLQGNVNRVKATKISKQKKK